MGSWRARRFSRVQGWRALERGQNFTVSPLLHLRNQRRAAIVGGWQDGYDSQIERWRIKLEGTFKRHQQLSSFHLRNAKDPGVGEGERLWAAGDKRYRFSDSPDGEQWISRFTGTEDPLSSIFVTADGKQIWVVGTRRVRFFNPATAANGVRAIPAGRVICFPYLGPATGSDCRAVGGGGTILESHGR